MILSLLRNVLPPPILRLYHRMLSDFAAALYRRPSELMMVIGVTGTNGKSTTSQFIGRLLMNCGYRVGWTTTAGFKIATHEWENKTKMTMLGRFQTQKLLRQMVDAHCSHAIIETSSQGVVQDRHRNINYDTVVFTNLTPEHIEAHGGFEKYKAAKGALFAHAAASVRKPQQNAKFPKTAVVNLDDPHADYFLSFGMDRRVGFGIEGRKKAEHPVDIELVARDVALSAQGTNFTLDGLRFQMQPFGEFNLYNMLAAIATCVAHGVPLIKLQHAVPQVPRVSGRLELIDEGQPFTVIVDYAYEPAALEALYAAVDLIPHKRVIHVTGSCGGGRDIARRAEIGRLVGTRADLMIVTNEDPYDEDPMTIINQISEAAVLAGKQDGHTLFRILSRRDAVYKAIELAQRGDLVLITGKGNELVMAVSAGQKLPWDDRVVARTALKTRTHAV